MMGQYAINREGLRKRKTYEEMVGYLQEGQPTIRYPDRTAKFIRNSIYMTQLDGPEYDEMLQQQENMKNEQLRNVLLRLQASRPGQPDINQLQAMASRGASAVGSRSGRISPRSSLMSASGSASGMGYESVADSDEYVGRPQFIPSNKSSASSSSSSSSSSSRTSSKSIVDIFGQNLDQATNEALIKDQLQEMQEIERQYKEEEQRQVREIKNLVRSGFKESGYNTIADELMKHRIQRVEITQQPASSSSAPIAQEVGEALIRPKDDKQDVLLTLYNMQLNKESSDPQMKPFQGKAYKLAERLEDIPEEAKRDLEKEMIRSNPFINNPKGGKFDDKRTTSIEQKKARWVKDSNLTKIQFNLISEGFDFKSLSTEKSLNKQFLVDEWFKLYAGKNQQYMDQLTPNVKPSKSGS